MVQIQANKTFSHDLQMMLCTFEHVSAFGIISYGALVTGMYLFVHQ
jgi:hypothetical protein